VEELLEALTDPRFCVRFEAVISIARMDSDPRLIEALCKLLDGTELSLSTIAAWALGRMGDESALPALRDGLDSDYRSIRAHCARALGALHDTSVVPLLLERLQTETDKGLRVAYAAALGQMKALEAIDTLFRILNSTQNEGARMELALSIARLTGHEQPFVRLLRQSRHDHGTTISQTVFALRRKFSGSDMGVLRALARDSASAFARNDFAGGVPLLAQLIAELPKTHCAEVTVFILNGCEKALRESGPGHLEYVILALHMLEITPASNIRE
jgi:HEAT repeat protein